MSQYKYNSWIEFVKTHYDEVRHLPNLERFAALADLRQQHLQAQEPPQAPVAPVAPAAPRLAPIMTKNPNHPGSWEGVYTTFLGDVGLSQDKYIVTGFLAGAPARHENVILRGTVSADLTKLTGTWRENAQTRWSPFTFTMSEDLSQFSGTWRGVRVAIK